MKDHNNSSLTGKGLKAVIYLLLIVVAIFCGVVLYGGTKPGFYYSCDSKIPATVKAGQTVDFSSVGNWRPVLVPGSKLYIIYADESTCTLVYEGEDAQHSSVARDVPLSSLEYDEEQIENVRKIHNCRSGMISGTGNNRNNKVVSVILVTILAFLLVRTVIFIINKVLLSGRE